MLAFLPDTHGVASEQSAGATRVVMREGAGWQTLQPFDRQLGRWPLLDAYFSPQREVTDRRAHGFGSRCVFLI